MVSRRDFLKISFAAGAGLFIPVRFHSAEAAAVAAEVARRVQFTQPTLDPDSITKFLDPMIIPPVMPNKGTIILTGGRNADYYEISVREFMQQILPTGLPQSKVWGYGAVGTNTYNYPSFTIEARWNAPVRVKWINDLKDANGNYLPHILPIDQTLHWANPPGGTTGRDTRPDPMNADPNPYSGPVPMVPHVHGAHVTQESDGYPEAWWLPAASNIPAGYATEGTFYQYYKDEFNAMYGVAWTPGSATYEYPNDQNATTLWYHDHTLGMTRNNVYAGPAGFYLIRGGPGDMVLELAQWAAGGAARTGSKAQRQKNQALLRDPHRDPGPRFQR